MYIGDHLARHPLTDDHASLEIRFQNPELKRGKSRYPVEAQSAMCAALLCLLSQAHATRKLLLVRAIAVHCANIHLKAAMVFAASSSSSHLPKSGCPSCSTAPRYRGTKSYIMPA